jgi:hypothetical protein
MLDISGSTGGLRYSFRNLTEALTGRAERPFIRAETAR